MSNEDNKNTEEQPQSEEQGGLLESVTEAADKLVDSATEAVEQVADTVIGSDAETDASEAKEEPQSEEVKASEQDAAPAPPAAKESAAVAAAPAVVGTYSEADVADSNGKRNERKTRDGIVVSNKMDKTISVAIERRLQHPIYGKYVKKTKKLIAHDEENQCQIGDIVRVMECRPLSRRKRWRLISVLEKAK